MKNSSRKYLLDKTGLILVFSVISIFYSCRQADTEEETYDIITVTNYTNTYDDTGRLSVVIEIDNTYSKVNDVYVRNTYKAEQKYKWNEDGTHEIKKTSDLSPREYEITRIGEKSEEHYTIRDGIDTIDYVLQRYYDKEMLKTEYFRRIDRQQKGLLGGYNRNDNHEKRYYYDKSGFNNKIIKHDFNSGEVIEEYRFKDVSYDDAIKQIPKSDNKQEIQLCFEEMEGDTVITRIFRENKLFYLTKEYESNGKTIQILFDGNYKVDNIMKDYKAGNVDIWVAEHPQSCIIDSTYKVNGKEIKWVHISPSNESIQVSEYDGKGNLTKKVYKAIYRETLPESEFEKMVKRWQEIKKDNSVAMGRDSSVNEQPK